MTVGMIAGKKVSWNDLRDSFRKAREAHLIHKAKTIEPLGINKRDEL